MAETCEFAVLPMARLNRSWLDYNVGEQTEKQSTLSWGCECGCETSGWLHLKLRKLPLPPIITVIIVKSSSK